MHEQHCGEVEMPCPSHQRRKAPAARPYAARVLGFRILTVKNSRKRNAARFPALAMSAGSSAPRPVFPITASSRLIDHLGLITPPNFLSLGDELFYLFKGLRFRFNYAV